MFCSGFGSKGEIISGCKRAKMEEDVSEDLLLVGRSAEVHCGVLGNY